MYSALLLYSGGLTVTLFATADGTITSVVDETDGTTDIWQSIDDDPATPTDTDWINNAIDPTSDPGFTEKGQWASPVLTETGERVFQPVTATGQTVFGLSSDVHFLPLLTDMPGDFDTATSATVIVRYRGQNFGSESLTLYAQFYQSDESTPLSNEVSVVTVSANTSFDNTAPVTITGIVAGSKTIWDGARLRMRWA